MHILCNQLLPNSGPPSPPPHNQDNHGPEPLLKWSVICELRPHHLTSIMLQKNTRQDLVFSVKLQFKQNLCAMQFRKPQVQKLCFIPNKSNINKNLRITNLILKLNNWNLNSYWVLNRIGFYFISRIELRYSFEIE